MTDPTINHADKARDLLHHRDMTMNLALAAGLAAAAQAHATLALEAQTARLADEARVANGLAETSILLGHLALCKGLDWVPDVAVLKAYNASIALIAARLDLTQDVTP